MAKISHGFNSRLRMLNSIQRKVSGSLGESERAYFAGLVDGKGVFPIYIGKQTVRVHRLVILLTIRSTNIEIIKLLKQYFGGYVIIDNIRETSRPPYIWKLARQSDIVLMLKQILPHMRIKRRQASLILKYCASRAESIDKYGHSAPIVKEELDIVREFLRFVANNH